MGATVIVVHHQGKAFKGHRSPFRGSSEIEAGCDIAYCLSKTSTEDGLTLKVRCFKTRHGIESEFQLGFDPGKGLFLPALTQEQKDMEAISKIISENPKVGVEEIRLIMVLPEQRVRNLLKRGEDTLWKTEAGPHNKHQYIPINEKVGAI